MCFLVTSLSYALWLQRRLLNEEYKTYICNIVKSFECMSILDWVWVFCAWPSVIQKDKWKGGSLFWSEGVQSHTPIRVTGIKHCMELQY